SALACSASSSASKVSASVSCRVSSKRPAGLASAPRPRTGGLKAGRSWGLRKLMPGLYRQSPAPSQVLELFALDHAVLAADGLAETRAATGAAETPCAVLRRASTARAT